MDKVIADKWVAALRSGEYDQGNGKLNMGGKFCCLGVLCDIAVKEGVISPRGSEHSPDLVIYGDEAAWLPKEVMDWSGMRTDSGSLGETSLVSMNDSGVPFLEIADTIEKDYVIL